MMYTLVIMLTISGFTHNSGSGVTIESIQGFRTEQECINAKAKMNFPRTTDTEKQRISYYMSCIPMSI